MLFRTIGFVGALAAATRAVETKPSIIYILTDDQDVHMQSLDYMPLLKKYIADEGTTYERHYCTTAICCPARVSIFTGKLSHNTNVTDVVAPYGGYPQFIDQSLNSNYLPIWLQDAGYNTYYASRLFIALMTTNYDNPHAAGWTSLDFLIDPFTHSCWNATWQRDMDPPVSREGTYNTDDLANKTASFFFVGTAPVAPHDEVVMNPITFNGSIFSPDDPVIRPQITSPKPAERHAGMFTDLKMLSISNVILPTILWPSGVHWVSRLPQLNQTIDEMAEQIIQELETLDIADNTYVIYSTDNGFHVSQNRLQPGNTCIPKGATTDMVTSHTDLAPTVFMMAGIEPKSDFDGVTIPLTEGEIGEGTRAEHLGIEYWGLSIVSSLHNKSSVGNTYKGIRVQSKDYNMYYSVHCTNEHELYDMTVDLFQINNLLPSGTNGTGMPVTTYDNSTASIIGQPLVKVSRLDAIMMVIKSCKGETWINPWGVLHPEGGYDDFYMKSIEQTSVSYSICANGYLVDAEGPQDSIIYQEANWSALI
ncbi:arylsulfatase [Dactylonectria macrodidyma]|uniref:Arylsulfatase n=1 Tax=Dactylonectria macrodidyma TaxID=307937 RepID=A0A9P9ESA7_9HYPO|nr:arylsulfatase [Dactylonectria macrodidyma]